MNYYNVTTFKIVSIDPVLYAKWVTDGNPKAQAFTLLPDPPTYDSATQHAPVFENGSWVVRDKTVEELQAEAGKVQDAATLSQILNFVTALKNGEGTAGERLQRLEIAVAYLIKKTLLQTIEQ